MGQPLPNGFVYAPEFLSPEEERDAIQVIEGLRFGSVQMHGVTARRRVAQFGWHYAFESHSLTPAAAMPAEFEAIRQRAAEAADIEAAAFAEVLVTEYPPGAGIGWHR